MTEEKKSYLDYSSDNGIVGFRLLIENNMDNKITFFTLNEKEEPAVFASIFMAAADVKNSALVIRDRHSGLDFFLPNGDKLFVSYVEAPEPELDPDDEEDPDKVRAMPAPKTKPIHHFLLLSLIPTPESKARGKLSLPTLTIHRAPLSPGNGKADVAGPAETSAKDDPKKTFDWGMVTGADRTKTVILAWMTRDEAQGTLKFTENRDADPTCDLSVDYPRGGTFKEGTAEVFAFGLFDDTPTALSQCSHAMNHLSKIKVNSLKEENEERIRRAPVLKMVQ